VGAWAGFTGAADAGLTMAAVNTAIKRTIGTIRFQKHTMIQLSSDRIGGYDPMNDEDPADKRCRRHIVSDVLILPQDD
jgi:hypothetical protein